MTLNTEQSVTNDREMIESNVLRTVVAPVAAVVMIVIAALIWIYGSPRTDSTLAPLPECSPPRSQNITI